MFTQFSVKTSLFNIFWRFFFPVKAEISYFSKMKKGDQKGDHRRRYFCLKLLKFPEILNFFQTKIAAPVIPLLIPLFHFWKIWYLSFHWKKKSSKNIKNSKCWIKLKSDHMSMVYLSCENYENELIFSEFSVFSPNWV